MRKLVRSVSFVAGLVGLLGFTGIGVAYAGSPVGGASPAIVQGTSITGHGEVHAEILPMSQVRQTSLNAPIRPDSGSGFDGSVSMDIDGEGWHMNHWSIAAQPLAPGQCAYSAYWFPANTIAFFGPDLCNTMDEPGLYFSDADDVTVDGDGWACSTVVGLAGKPCVFVWQ